MSATYATPSIAASSTRLPLETDFLAVATAAHNRGFPVCPVHPAEKRGVFWAQYKHPAKNLSALIVGPTCCPSWTECCCNISKNLLLNRAFPRRTIRHLVLPHMRFPQLRLTCIKTTTR